MLLPGIVAAALMISASAVVSLDSAPAKVARYAFLRWQRRRRSRSDAGDHRYATPRSTRRPAW